MKYNRLSHDVVNCARDSHRILPNQHQKHQWNKIPRRMDPHNQDITNGESYESETLSTHLFHVPITADKNGPITVDYNVS